MPNKLHCIALNKQKHESIPYKMKIVKLGVHSVNYHVGELTLADSYQGIELSWRIFFDKSTTGRESPITFYFLL
ncbi:hypothetical protein YC2023_022915 [Brassica napus]